LNIWWPEFDEGFVDFEIEIGMGLAKPLIAAFACGENEVPDKADSTVTKFQQMGGRFANSAFFIHAEPVANTWDPSK
jgi:hypothetical protein